MKKLEKVYKNRKIPDDYTGVICTFDLDKTYLATKFEKISGLFRIAFEKAEDKKNIPGAAALVRELRRGVDQNISTPIYFISGSPEELETVVREKFELDGVAFDGILFKNFREAIRKFKFKKIVDKIGFKLSALIYARSVFPPNADEILFGDDSEYDSTVYSLYSDIISGNLKDYEVMTILRKWDVDGEDLELIAESMKQLHKSAFKPREAVRGIFIHLEMKSSPSDHSQLSPLVNGTSNYFQTSVLLYKMNLISKAGLFRIIMDLTRHYHFKAHDFAVSLEDLIRRSLISSSEAQDLLKLVSMGNPLMISRGWMMEFMAEVNRIIDRLAHFSEHLPGIASDKKYLTLTEKYLLHKPVRRV